MNWTASDCPAVQAKSPNYPKSAQPEPAFETYRWCRGFQPDGRHISLRLPNLASAVTMRRTSLQRHSYPANGNGSRGFELHMDAQPRERVRRDADDHVDGAAGARAAAAPQHQVQACAPHVESRGYMMPSTQSGGPPPPSCPQKRQPYLCECLKPLHQYNFIMRHELADEC